LDVALGALGAHFFLNKIATGLITAEQVNGFDTGVKYHIYQTITMFILFLFAKHTQHKFINWFFNCFFAGIILFSGSLYFLCTRNLFNASWLSILGPITPIGGLFFVAGWVFIALIGWGKKA
jgi:uncharacterized membrane protein YgdD (TMEM256/DUF423 family)